MSRTLEERLAGVDPEPWIPEEPGDTIIGEVEEISARDSQFGQPGDTDQFVTLLTEHGDVMSVAIFGTVLKKKFADLNPQEGDTLGFKFLGEQVPRSGGKPYKNWKLMIARKVVAAPEGAAVGGEFPDE
jgi:propanediol utilization protein